VSRSPHHADPTAFSLHRIVGQEPMKRALVLNAIYPAIGGILISASAARRNLPRCAPWRCCCQKSL